MFDPSKNQSEVRLSAGGIYCPYWFDTPDEAVKFLNDLRDYSDMLYRKHGLAKGAVMVIPGAKP